MKEKDFLDERVSFEGKLLEVTRPAVIGYVTKMLVNGRRSSR